MSVGCNRSGQNISLQPRTCAVLCLALFILCSAVRSAGQPIQGQLPSYRGPWSAPSSGIPTVTGRFNVSVSALLDRITALNAKENTYSVGLTPPPLLLQASSPTARPRECLTTYLHLCFLQGIWWVVLSWTDAEAYEAIANRTAAAVQPLPDSGGTTGCGRPCDGRLPHVGGCCDDVWLPDISLPNLLRYDQVCVCASCGGLPDGAWAGTGDGGGMHHVHACVHTRMHACMHRKRVQSAACAVPQRCVDSAAAAGHPCSCSCHLGARTRLRACPQEQVPTYRISVGGPPGGAPASGASANSSSRVTWSTRIVGTWQVPGWGPGAGFGGETMGFGGEQRGQSIVSAPCRRRHVPALPALTWAHATCIVSSYNGMRAWLGMQNAKCMPSAPRRAMHRQRRLPAGAALSHPHTPTTRLG